MFYHIEKGWSKRTASQNRSEKELRVRDGTAHASLVYDGADAVGWCQYGPPGELPRVKNRKDYLEGKPALPDWRITCFFVDRKRRRRGVASTALKAALEAIAAQGGGRVEAYPEDTDAMGDRGSFLWSGTVSMFEREGFNRVRPLGKRSWVMTKVVRGAIHR